MATIDDWAEMPLSREQLVLFDPTLDGAIAEDDPVRLGEVAFDGTRVRAHNSRYATRTAQTLAEKLAALDALFEELLTAWEAGDAAEQRSLAGHDSPTRLLPELAELTQRREKIRAALAQAQAADDPTQPVPESQRNDLPRNSQQKLDKSCFVYDAEHDQYHCPQGQTLAFEKSKSDERGGVRVTLRVYRCAACAGCPLAERCVSAQSKQGRTITRDGDEAVRDRTAARMASDAGRQLYDQRPHMAETTFAHLKSILGLRQFLLRGLDKVKHEWRWACMALNLGKLVRHLACVCRLGGVGR